MHQIFQPFFLIFPVFSSFSHLNSCISTIFQIPQRLQRLHIGREPAERIGLIERHPAQGIVFQPVGLAFADAAEQAMHTVVIPAICPIYIKG